MVLRPNPLNTSFSTQGGVLPFGFAPVRLQRNPNLRKKKRTLTLIGKGLDLRTKH